MEDPGKARAMGQAGWEMRLKRYGFGAYLEDLETVLAGGEPRHQWVI